MSERARRMIGRRPVTTVIVVSLFVGSVALAVAGTWLDVVTRSTVLPDGTGDPAPLFLWAVLSFTAVGAVVAAQRPANPIGWLLVAIGLLWQIDHVAGDLRTYTALTRPNLPGAGTAAWLYEVTWVLPVAGLPLLVLLYPTGRLPSSRWRAAVAALGLGAACLLVAIGVRPGPFTNSPTIDNPIGMASLAGAVAPIEAGGNLLFAVAIIAGLASIVVRYRGGDPVTRQQLRGLLWAFGLVVAAFVVADLLAATGVGPGLVGVVRTTPMVLVPIACGIAVLKHQLLDIDLVINRLVVYGGLTCGIVALYIGVVVVFGSVVGARGGGGEPNVGLVIVATTFAALLFDPARRRLERLADRAVYGRRASPYEALAAMTRRVESSYVVDDVPARMAQAIAAATGGQSEVWITTAHGSSPVMTLAAARPREVSRVDAPPVAVVASGDIAGRDATFLVRHGAEVLGALTVTTPKGGRLAAAERRLLEDLAASAAFVLHNARLVDELRGSRQRLVAAQDDERRRVERDLHDGAQQRLLELSLTLRRAERQAERLGRRADASVPTNEVAGVVEVIDEANHQLQQALHELRDLARGIHPAILTEQGLGPALRSLTARVTVPTDLDLQLDGRLPPAVESTAYFVASEALTNVVKHAGDTTASLRACHGDGTLTLDIVDRGPGGADPDGGGLRGLADRVAALGGTFEVETLPDSGTRVRALLLCG